MPSVINQLVKRELTEKLRKIPNGLLVDFTGLSARKADELRAMLRKQGGGMLVVKNSLAARALDELGRPAVARLIEGPTAFVYADADPVTFTKSLLEWSRKEPGLKIRGAMLGSQALGPQDVARLAALPPLIVLRAQVVGAIASPLTGFIGALQGILRSFVGVVKAIADKGTEKI